MVESAFLKEAPPSFHSPVADRHLASTAEQVFDDRLVVEYRYLCSRGARKFWRSGLDRCDLEQVAAIGLIKAARRFDERASTPFEAYAWVMIVGELMHHVRDHERTIRIPRSLRELERRFIHEHDGLLGNLGREPSDNELAVALGVLVSTVRAVRRTREAAVPLGLESLDTRAVAEPKTLDAEDRILFDAAFRELSDLERRIIVGVYVLGLTQQELARRLGVSAKRVSRARHGALRRMQRAWIP